MDKLKKLIEDYAGVAIATHFSIYGLTFTGFFLAISNGFQPDSAAGSASTLGAAWLATKLTQPLRIAVTVVLTPLIARLRRKPSPPSDPIEPPDDHA